MIQVGFVCLASACAALLVFRAVPTAREGFDSHTRDTKSQPPNELVTSLDLQLGEASIDCSLHHSESLDLMLGDPEQEDTAQDANVQRRARQCRSSSRRQRRVSIRPRRRNAMRRLSTSIYDARLRLAYDQASAHSVIAGLSKRQLYEALTYVGLQQISAGEQLATWQLFDGNANGRVELHEWLALGAALLEHATSAQRFGPAQTTRPQHLLGFARRRHSDEARWRQTRARMHSLARRRSVLALRSSRGNGV